MTQLQSQESPQTSDRELIYDRDFNAPIQAVYDAFVDPEQLAQWWGPEEMTIAVCEIDVREGGAWKTVMRAPDGKEFTVAGVYKRIEPPTHLSFTWAWQYPEGPGHETLITIAFSELAGDRTHMHFEQRTFAEAEHRNNHDHGWTSTWTSLEKYLARG